MGSKHINFYRPEFQQEWFRLIETPRMIFGFSFFDLTENLGAKRNEKRLFFLQESCKTLHFTCTLLALLRKSLIINGAGEGNRTLVSGLGSLLNRSEFALWTARRFHRTAFAAFAGDLVFETLCKQF